ncbi:MAG: hypothetical protein K8R77_09455 [Anaerolineaceae bacterium]|nr:hypothetical protein [Anaerolineaceae bacterium]
MTEIRPSPKDQSDTMGQVRTIMQDHRDQLLALPNVVGLGVGLRQKNGEWTDTVALIVMVKQKLPLESLTADQRIPSEIDGVPVDVQETSSLSALG